MSAPLFVPWKIYIFIFPSVSIPSSALFELCSGLDLFSSDMFAECSHICCILFYNNLELLWRSSTRAEPSVCSFTQFTNLHCFLLVDRVLACFKLTDLKLALPVLLIKLCTYYFWELSVIWAADTIGTCHPDGQVISCSSFRKSTSQNPGRLEIIKKKKMEPRRNASKHRNCCKKQVETCKIVCKRCYLQGKKWQKKMFIFTLAQTYKFDIHQGKTVKSCAT